MKHLPQLQGETSSTETIQHFSDALAAVGIFLLASRAHQRKSAIKVRGGRARALSAARDKRGRFLTAH